MDSKAVATTEGTAMTADRAACPDCGSTGECRTYRVVCAWCGGDEGERHGVLDPPTDVSHGICQGCRVELLARARKGGK